jgi:plasmid stabilization system protein ParE
MIYTVRLREEAEYDLEDAASWYESQKSGLGHDFLDIVEQALNSITQNPFSYPIVHRGTHRAVLSRFPFAIFYILRASEVLIIAVMHGSRNPARWQHRT